MKYLGIEIDNKINYFKTQKDKIIENARKMTCITTNDLLELFGKV